jgi:hypothetical protein
VAILVPPPALPVPAAVEPVVAVPPPVPVPEGILNAISAREAMRLAATKITDTVAENVIRIVGERTAASTEPQTWRMFFYDPSASRNARAVVTRGTEIVSVDAGLVELGNLRLFAYKPTEVIAPAQFRIDSRDALAAVRASPDLAGIPITSSDFLLSKESTSSPPVWRLNLFSHEEEREIPIGEAFVSAETGNVVELKLKLDRVKKAQAAKKAP